MTATFRLGRITAWKATEENGRVIRLYSPEEAEARFAHHELWGRNRTPNVVPIFEKEKSEEPGAEGGCVLYLGFLPHDTDRASDPRRKRDIRKT